jgi:DsbC/DsbD-like thiol-disulfide interchange protein
MSCKPNGGRAALLLAATFGVLALPAVSISILRAAEPPVVRVAVLAPKKATTKLPFDLVVELTVAPNYHIYPPGRDQVNIPTQVTVEAPTGFLVGQGKYPKPKIGTSAGDEIEMYEGKVRVIVPITPPKSVKGSHVFVVRTRYQACTTEMCLPPADAVQKVTIPFASDR